ncbi:MAG: T9SS type A sorting domain-containing protein [Bacteroidia bacterium]|nr:T9SS type A sorting domain-containing protein [Bacteroidia bacterium]
MKDQNENRPHTGMGQRPSMKLKKLTWKPFAVGIMAVCGIFLTNTYKGGDKGRLDQFNWRQLVMIDNEMVSGEEALLDFPVKIHMIQEDLKHVDEGGKVLHPRGHDIRFTGEDGASLLIQRLVSYDPKKGELIAWVNQDSLFPNKKSYCFIYYGSQKSLGPAEKEPEQFRMKGHFIDGGKPNKVLKNKLYSQNWLQTELNNHNNDEEFIKLGPLEELDADPRVEYAYFKAGLKGGSLVLVEWASKKEKNNKLFQVQRSPDLRNYNTLGKLGGSGKTSFQLGYSFSDPHPLEDMAYYRLKQVNRDGTFIYTEPVTLAYDLHDKGLEIKDISPNPFNEFFVAEYTSSHETEAQITIYDGQGQVLEEHSVKVKKGSNLFTFKDKYNLQKGAYVFSLIGPKRKLLTREVRKTYEPVDNARR